MRAAERAAQEGVNVLVAPTLNVTLSWCHMQFYGFPLRLEPAAGSPIRAVGILDG